MSIMQMLFIGEALSLYLPAYLTTASVTRPKVTVIPSSTYESSPINTSTWLNATIEVWGGGGASGSAFRGQSGNGGGGGYISGIIPIRDLGITELFVRVGAGGGGPADGDPYGISTYYDIPSEEYPTSYGGSTISYVGGTSAQSTTTVSLSGLSLQNGDVVLVASVADGGTLNTPTGYTPLYSGQTVDNASYVLSFKQMGTTPDTLVNGLSVDGVIDGGANDGLPSGTSHIAIAFRGCSSSFTSADIISAISTVTSASPGSPDPPSINIPFANAMAVAFNFHDNISITPTNPPSGYTTAQNATVGSVSNGTDEASIFSAYRLLGSSLNVTENPATWSINNNERESYVAITLALRPKVGNPAFSSKTGGCGGSSGGFSGVFYNSPRVPLLIAGGGGGGGGSSSTGGIGGNGAPGGGSVASSGTSGTGGTPGGGGGGGTQSAGGSGGTASGTNSGESGVVWNLASVGGFLTGGRGANSPVTDTTTTPRYGANATGGYGRGSGGGSSRTTSTSILVADPVNCGGAGGGGYYGGGGGAAGNGGGGGAGGGGSNYASTLVSVKENIPGSGILPGNTTSLNYIAGFGYGGTGVLASGVDVQGNPGFSGMIVISYTLAP